MQLIDRSIRWLAYSYLLRFPILTAVAAVGLVIAAFTIARPLLGNLFDVNLAYAQVWLSFTVFATAWVIMVAARLVVLYGPVRFQLEPYIEPYRIRPDLRWWHIVFFGTTIALPVIAGAIYYTYQHNESISLAALDHRGGGRLCVVARAVVSAGVRAKASHRPRSRCAADSAVTRQDA